MCVQYGNAIVCGSYPKLTKRKPKNWFDKGYRIRIPYPFKWREKLGKVECDCATVIETYRIWYGFDITHDENCAIEKHVRRYPGILNFIDYSGIIASSEE